MHNGLAESAEFFLGIGGILLLGVLTDFVGKRTYLPRVTLLLLFGIVIGEQGFQLLPELFTNHFEWVANSALLVVGFLLGGQFDLKSLKRSRSELIWISSAGALCTLLFVFVGLFFTGLTIPLAIILACIASATAPAPIVDIAIENKDTSAFTTLLLKIVAIDDVWALILFSFGLANMSIFLGTNQDGSALLIACYQIFGALILGILLGIPAAHLTGRITPGQPSLVEALGLVFTCGGIALWLDVSFLIAVMTMGAMITNLEKHHEYAFHEIENVEWPFMVVFFVLAGASLEFQAIQEISIIGTVYILFRILGKCIGGWIGAWLSGAKGSFRKWIGLAMLPQAGVEIGMALIAANQFPEYKQLILSLVISATVFFELVGPPLTRYAMKHSTMPESMDK